MILNVRNYFGPAKFKKEQKKKSFLPKTKLLYINYICTCVLFKYGKHQKKDMNVKKKKIIHQATTKKNKKSPPLPSPPRSGTYSVRLDKLNKIYIYVLKRKIYVCTERKK